MDWKRERRPHSRQSSNPTLRLSLYIFIRDPTIEKGNMHVPRPHLYQHLHQFPLMCSTSSDGTSGCPRELYNYRFKHKESASDVWPHPRDPKRNRLTRILASPNSPRVCKLRLNPLPHHASTAHQDSSKPSTGHLPDESRS
jgi:hypothetical protein